MDETVAPDARRVTGLVLNDQVVAALQAVLPAVAERTVAAVTVEVPSYADAFSGRMGQRIEGAVQMALGAFLQLAARSHDSDPGPPLAPALEGAYELGRGEARQGRSIDALLSAYRVGARVAWRELSETAVDGGLPPLMIARFAELVFAFIDELSAASVSGHADELASSDRERRRHLDPGRHRLDRKRSLSGAVQRHACRHWDVEHDRGSLAPPSIGRVGIVFSFP